MNIHHLKIDAEYFAEVMAGKKDFEIRRNDRGFMVGDWVILHETIKGEKTGQKTPPRCIQYVFEGGAFGLDSDFVVFQSKQIGSICNETEIPPIDQVLAKTLVENGDFIKTVKNAHQDVPINIAAGFFKEGYELAKSIKDGE